MGLEIAFDAVPEVAQEHPQPFATGELERGNEIAIPCNDNDCLDYSRERQSRDVQPNTQIDTLLLDRRDQIFRLHESRTTQKLTECPAADFPSCRAGFAQPLRKVWLHLQFFEKSGVISMYLRLAEDELLLADRIREYVCCRSSVIEVDAQPGERGHTFVARDC